jgi:cytoskeletal protein CcmA (bactofilin family)
MFRRNRSDIIEESKSEGPSTVQQLESAKLRQAPQVPGRGGPAPFHPDVPNRPAPQPYNPPPAPEQVGRDGGESKRLTVGRDITLSGEILDCERLTVEGTVHAKLSSARLLEISKGGQFHGAVNIENAEIAGTFEGELTVRNRLHIHASGRVFGKVRYGQLEVERGGRLTGDIAHDAEHHEGEVKPVEMAAPEARGARAD